MDFDEAVRAVERLEGQTVSVTVWGAEGERGGMLVSLTGNLLRVPPFDPEEFAEAVPRATLEALRAATQPATFAVGDRMFRNQIMLSRDRFLRGEPLDPPGSIEIVTRDGIIWVQRYVKD
jgi:hypothetical protein